MKNFTLSVALLASALAVALVACTGAGAHLNPCHFTHSCPSDNHTYTWTSPDGKALICTSHSFEKLATDTLTVSYGGRTYWCHAADAASAPPTSTTSTTSTASNGSVDVGETLYISKRTKTSGCVRGALPDSACSPGAFYTGLTKDVLCSSNFHTGDIRNVPGSVKAAVYREYGLAPTGHGHTYEVDHIISLELGGSNQIGNLYPEAASANPGFHTKDALENKTAALMCDGKISLVEAQHDIATNWIALYKKVYGTNPR
jgi:hypothetical protein